jgi:hypothetical protein
MGWKIPFIHLLFLMALYQTRDSVFVFFLPEQDNNNPGINSTAKVGILFRVFAFWNFCQANLRN